MRLFVARKSPNKRAELVKSVQNVNFGAPGIDCRTLFERRRRLPASNRPLEPGYAPLACQRAQITQITHRRGKLASALSAATPHCAQRECVVVIIVNH